MAIPSRMEDRILVLSKLKQTNYATPVTDVNLALGKRVPVEAALFGQPDIKRWTNMPLSMMGTDFATQTQEVQRDMLESLSLTGDTWLLGWILAFAMGASSSVLDAGTAYIHTIKPLDPSAVAKDMPAATIYAEAANVAGLQRRLLAMIVKDMAIDFPANAPLKITANLIGSGAVTSGALASPPALMTLVPLMSNDLIFKYGPQGAPVDIELADRGRQREV